MIRWSLVATARAPGGGAELRLMQRGEEFSIMIGGNELMNSRLGGSEAAMARLVGEHLHGRDAGRWLIGGLGMGFTLGEALRCSRADAQLTVAELVPEVAQWARGPLASVFDDHLDDPRLHLHIGDVADLIAASAPGAWDAILLDVDNGPDSLSSAENDRLYTAPGLHAAHLALRPGGVLAVWSAAPDARFVRRLEAARFAVVETPARARRGGRGGRHVIWIAAKR